MTKNITYPHTWVVKITITIIINKFNIFLNAVSKTHRKNILYFLFCYLDLIPLLMKDHPGLGGKFCGSLVDFIAAQVELKRCNIIVFVNK